MKKILIPILALLLSFSFLETKAQSGTKKATAQKVAATKTKKDGTPDMRYKENKAAAKAETKHFKKDGTPDKRYKENKK